MFSSVGPPHWNRTAECGSQEFAPFSTAVGEQADAELPKILTQNVVHYKKRGGVAEELQIVPPYQPKKAARHTRILVEVTRPIIDDNRKDQRN
jgi:hypothetical protein